MTPSPDRSAAPAPDPRRHRRPARLALLAAVLVALGLPVVAAPTPVSAGEAPVALPAAVEASLSWGVKASFRSYVTGPAGGTITLDGGAEAGDDGAYVFPAEAGATGTADAVDVDFDGSVRFVAHEGALDLTVGGLEVVIDGDEGVLRADVVSKSLTDSELVEYPDVELAALDLSAVTPTVDAGWVTFEDVPATMTTEGAPAFAAFYPAGTALDPLTVSVPEPEWNPTVTVSKASGLDPYGQTITVTGTGFDPEANVSTRPPVPVGMATGVYVVFGRFADPWRPSQGAPGSARTVLDQMWPLPAASKAAAEAAFGPNPQYAVMQPDGSFEVELDVARVEGPGTFGVYTYAAGGAASNANQETFTPLSFEYATFADVPDTYLFHEEITWLATKGYASGFPDGTFRPREGVTRAALASFLYRMAGSPAVPPGAPSFSDVPPGHVFHDAVSWLASEKILNGYPDGTFRPGAAVTRDATSAFLYRMAGSPAVPPGAPSFSDVPPGHVFHDAVSWLAAVAVVKGFDDGTFRPDLHVSREGVAAFLFRFDALDS